MGHLIQPRNIKQIITKEGETQVRIVIDLNINLTAGSVEIGGKGKKRSLDDDEPEVIEEAPAWEIPNFSSGEKIKFGKKE